MEISDFNFIAGSWDSRQWRLVKPLSGNDDGYEFDATLECQVLLGGAATFDVMRAPEHDLEGITLRLYSPQEQVWRIWWASKTSGGQLDVPVVGRFVDGIGTFECDDTFDGTAIRVRYEWSQVDTPNPRWQQAFSTDGGQSWEVNWVATFRRRS